MSSLSTSTPSQSKITSSGFLIAPFSRRPASSDSGANKLSRVSAPVYRERPASGEPAGLLVLHHGRGADEHDLLPLADTLDPERRLHVVTPRGPLTVPGWPGSHWYVVPRVGFPDVDTFRASYELLGRFHDELWQRTGLGPAQTVLGGFSMGTVMSYALAFGAERPAPAGVLALSGFIPTVEGWSAELHDRGAVRAFIAHGSSDSVIPVDFARDARDRLRAGGLDVDYREFAGGYAVDPAYIPAARIWLSETLSGVSSDSRAPAG
jgi:phospholipase/carboxylesterase